MIYVTGDTHGHQVMWHNSITSFLKPEDTIICTGDYGIGFFESPYWAEEMFYDYVSDQDYTVVFVDGNHENFTKLNSYEISEWNGGKVHFIRKNIIHLMRGEIYNIEGKKLFALGGASSFDKEMRIPGKSWWPEEMPNSEEYQHAIENLLWNNYKVDYIITHTAPEKTIDYMVENHMGPVAKLSEELPLTTFLQRMDDMVTYKSWYFGHMHCDKKITDNKYCVFLGIRQLDSGNLIKWRF